ncbi:MAG: NAD(P)H-dependent oxidoreductase subunit E [Rhodospirillales bacterium]|nr:NAD(P)H-dependent oxidoreductase subunit E [Rhodospirillales bacterium]
MKLDNQQYIRKSKGENGSARFQPKGRLLSEDEETQIRDLLKHKTLQRHELIEYLHVINDTYNFLKIGHLHALAKLLSISMVEVYEVASFYSHFDILDDDEIEPAPITIRVCSSITCELFNSKKLFSDIIDKDIKNVRVVSAPCMGRCFSAPVCEVGHRHIDYASVKKVELVIDEKNFEPDIPNYEGLEEYQLKGGYKVLEACITGKLGINEVITELSSSSLKGLGGAGFPTGKKWEFVLAEPEPRLMAVNADEGEPGTFKDRYHLERTPHQFLEGMLIGAWAINAKTVFIYLRDEYPAIREILLNEIHLLQKIGLSNHTNIEIRRGAGAYICGEESAMIESIEGKRGIPRHRPPYVAQSGIFEKPTLVNNVETLHWIPIILQNGAKWFSSQGDKGRGLRSYSVSGRVKEPGVKIVSAGSTVAELIDHAGGMMDGHVFSGYLPGGASGGILPSYMADIPLDFGELEKYGCLIGSHAIVIFSNQDDPRKIALNLMEFFEDESCGQCTPCRVGTEKAVKLMTEKNWNTELLKDLSDVMADSSICGLGQAAPNPLLCVMKYFPNIK